MGTAGFPRPPDGSLGTVPEVTVGLDVNGPEQQLRVDAGSRCWTCCATT
jgi:hypothetical protein